MKMRCRLQARRSIRWCAAVFVIPASAFAGNAVASTLLFDNVTAAQSNVSGALLTSTGSTPNYFMGDAYVLAPGATDITGLDMFPVNLTGTSFVGLQINLYIWGNVNTGTVSAAAPAFSNLLGAYSLTATGNFSTGFYFPFQSATPGSSPGITLRTPLALPSTVSTCNSSGTVSDLIGLTCNYQWSTDGITYSNYNFGTSLISYGVPPTTGADYFNGYYRNANSETNGDFTSSLRTLGLTDQNLALRVYGDVTSGIAQSVNWASAAGGDWNTATNWNPNAIPVAGDDVIFNTASGSNYTVTASRAQVVQDLYVQSDNLTIDLNAVPSALTINGKLAVGVPQTSGSPIAGSLTLTNSFGFSAGNVTAGSVLVGSNGATGKLTIGSGSTNAPVTLSVAGSVSIGAGSLLTLSTGGKLTLSTLYLAGTTGEWTGLMDIGSGELDLASPTLLATVTNQVQQAFNNGKWNGSGGITSSAAAANSMHLNAVGVITNNVSGSALYGGTGVGLGTFNGGTPGLNDVLVKYTYYGDANLDGKVDGSDYARIDSSYLAESTEATPFSVGITGWFNGDFNYDGTVDGSDYTLMDNAFNLQGNSGVYANAIIGGASSGGLTFDGTVTATPIGSGQGDSSISDATASPTNRIATTSVPEPASLGLIGAVAIGLLSRRSKRR